MIIKYISKHNTFEYAGIELEQIFLSIVFSAPPFYDFLMLFICLKIYFYDKIPEFVDYIKDGEGLNSVTNLLDSFLDESRLELTAPL